ncbi:hypothetical protein [Rubrobacter calidifluminis]|uniref:hypothetical protein n=1 Tax=Rubrobacter calidifluminis TaxID=1392640 RepID=UPI00235E20C7|nr:hypothetical protein [Rubrobacter calidifluminis]
MFGRTSRIEKLKNQAEDTSFDLLGSFESLYEEVRPFVERLLYDDDLRNNIRTLIDSGRRIYDEVSGQSPTEVVSRLWDDDKLRREVEAAVAAAEAGSRRIRGEKVRDGGSSSGKILFVLAAATGVLFLNPKTGPAARRFAREAYSSLASRS